MMDDDNNYSKMKLVSSYQNLKTAMMPSFDSIQPHAEAGRIVGIGPICFHTSISDSRPPVLALAPPNSKLGFWCANIPRG